MEQVFFISYTEVNEPWARWIAVELEQAGYSTTSQTLDVLPGNDFVHEMHMASAAATHTIAVLSPAYFESRFGGVEWRAAVAADPSGRSRKLIPVRVQPCEPPGLLASRAFVDLVGVDEQTARARLLAAVGRPNRALGGAYPGSPVPRFPGAGPDIDNTPPRIRNFIGRVDLLEQLHARIESADGAVAAIHGLGGVGKTALVKEFAHRYAGDYDIIWYVNAERPSVAITGLAALAHRLGIRAADQSAAVEELFEVLRRRARWLLIYDNAEDPAHLEDLLPRGGAGSVLVTSQYGLWSRLAEPVRLDVLNRQESVDFLARRATDADADVLDALADLLGDLPLALEEAAAYLESTGIDVGSYIELFNDRARDLFGLGATGSGARRRFFPGQDGDAAQRRLATVWEVSLEKVRDQAPAAEHLLALCAFLAPATQHELLKKNPTGLPEELAASVRDPLAYNTMIAALRQYSLASVEPTRIVLHRLVQTVIQARCSPDEEREWAVVAIKTLRAAFPVDPDVEQWAECERILPHVLVAAGHADRLGVAGEATGSLLGQASIYLCDRGQHRQALPLAEKAVELTESALGPSAPQVGSRRDELGRILLNLGELRPARHEFELSVRIAEDAGGPDHPDVGIRRNNLGLVLRELGELNEAKEQHELALRITERAHGPDHPDMGIRRNNLGLVLQDLGELDEAKEQYELALHITERAYGPDHFEVGIRRHNLGWVLRARGDYADARTQYEAALRITLRRLGPDHPHIGSMRNNLGSLLRLMGDSAAARTQISEAIRITEAAFGSEHPDVGLWRTNLGRILADLGFREDARHEFQQALEITQAVFGPQHPRTAEVREAMDGLSSP